MKKALVFYKGRPPRGQKTAWVMHEYRQLPAEGTSKVSPSTSSMMRDESWVLCRILQKTDQLPPVQLMDDQGLSKALAGLFVSHREIDLPPGFRFFPTDVELIVHYLCHRATTAAPGPATVIIPDLDIYSLEPWELPDDARLGGQQEWYFFSQRDHKYPTGSRTKRATRSGYWKASGKGRTIATTLSASNNSRMQLGFKKTLVFYKGRPPNGDRTSWVMHEYRLDRDITQAARWFKRLGGSSSSTACSTMLHDEWLLCKIFYGTNQQRWPLPFLDDDDGQLGDSFSAALLFDDDDTPLFPPLPPIPCINDHDRAENGHR